MGEQYEKAVEMCEAMWPNFFFTPLVMVEWLLDKSQTSWREFVKEARFRKVRERLRINI